LALLSSLHRFLRVNSSFLSDADEAAPTFIGVGNEQAESDEAAEVAGDQTDEIGDIDPGKTEAVDDAQLRRGRRMG